MVGRSQIFVVRCLPAWLVLLVGNLVVASSAVAYSPESPEVRAVIEKGLGFLTTVEDPRVGGKALIALCFLKNGRDVTHIRCQQAVKACYECSLDAGTTDNYSLGLAIIFLCEADPVAHQQRISVLVENLLSRQKPHGGWGYHDRLEGDTSQTQYAVLGLWMAVREGNIEVPMDAIDKVASWFMRTQDPSGGWGYQGIDTGSLQRIAQQGVSLGLSTAGIASMYVVADLIQMSSQQAAEAESGKPEALKVVEDEQQKKSRKRSGLEAKSVRNTIAGGNQYVSKNFKIQSGQWNFYYLYTFERYSSYKELADKKFAKDPSWYNEGFQLLAKSQTPGGGWNADNDTPVSCTAFAVLFLSRSAKKAIVKVAGELGDGVLVGGMGLPPNTSDIREKNGKVVETPLSGSVDEILSIIEDPDNPELSRMVESSQTVVLDENDTKRESQILRLRKMVRAGNYETRMVAVRSLAKVRELANVPILLYALTDPDLRVVAEADRGLRFVSRKFTGVGLHREPTIQQVKAAQKAWRDWYLSIVPDGELLD